VIVYVNGDSHTAAAEAVNSAAFAEDDGYPELGRQPHPDNLRVSWGQQLANRINADFVCDAESAASNTRILRTTRDWIKKLPPWESCVVIVQWSTWEREEWFYNNSWWQVNASGIDTVPAALEERYKNYVINVDWAIKTLQAHDKIWNMHLYLKQLKIKHFNCLFSNSFIK
jgi:hypothetical protein